MKNKDIIRDELGRWLVNSQNCGGCFEFDGFGCDRSPIIKEGEEKYRCDEDQGYENN